MKVITICGSSRFVHIVAVCSWIIERDENAIVHSLHLLPAWYLADADHQAEKEGVAEQMDELHLRKIDRSDEIFVVNRDDYIGESTTREVAYAEKKGLPIRWYTHDAVGTKVEAIIKEFIARPESEQPANAAQQLKAAIALVREVGFSQNHHPGGTLDQYLSEIEQRAAV